MRALGLVVPLYDEAELCTCTARRLLEVMERADSPFELLFVDNGSRDGTHARIAELCRLHPSARLLHLRRNAGYGGGILAGLAQLETPLVGWHWGDGQIDPEIVLEAWRMLERDGLDMVQARRVERQDGLLRSSMSRSYHLLARALFDVAWSDLNGCPKILTREALRAVSPRERGWLLDFEVMCAVGPLHLRLGRVEAVMRPRPGGGSHVRLSTVLEFLGRMPSISRRTEGSHQLPEAPIDR